jgi:hypothetical protein
MCQAQTTVSFGYDEAGNRKSRYIPLGGQSQAFYETITAVDKVYDENLGDNKKLLIYPNPTKGELRIDVQGYEDESNVIISLFSLTGSLLITKKVVSGSETLDLSGYPNASYVLKVVLQDKTSEWVIIKE